MRAPTMDSAHPALARFRKWAPPTLGAALLGYAALAVWQGLETIAAALAAFSWGYMVPVLALTLVNYALRFYKWDSLLRRVGVVLPWQDSAWIFTTGLAMVITPGRAGELLKPYLAAARAGAPLTRTLPALLTERVTDGLAVVMLAGIGVGTWHPDGAWLLAALLIGTVGGIAVIYSERATQFSLALVARAPLIRRWVKKIDDLTQALRITLRPLPLAQALAISLVAWGAECVGYWLIFKGLGANATLDVSTFLYASATVFGGPSPGGMGIADGALIEGAAKLVPNLSNGDAVVAALLVRLATLWFGVALGALSLSRASALLARLPALGHRDGGP